MNLTDDMTLKFQRGSPVFIDDICAVYSATLGEIVDEGYTNFQQYLGILTQQKPVFIEDDENDQEMKKMLLDEGYECKEMLPKIVAELKILLLPKDKNDERSCILEVRAGTGGEEAALFDKLCLFTKVLCAEKTS